LIFINNSPIQHNERTSMAKSFSLEAFKFSVYLSIPIAMTVFFAMNPSNLEEIIRNRMYVVYPASAPDPPSDAEMKRLIEFNKKKRGKDSMNNNNNKWGFFSRAQK
jgi:protein PET100, fungi type